MTNVPLPVLIDMARCSAFIKLNPRLLVFHGFQKRFGLTFAHLPFFFRFGLGNLRVLFRWLLGFVFMSRVLLCLCVVGNLSLFFRGFLLFLSPGSSLHVTGKFLGLCWGGG